MNFNSGVRQSIAALVFAAAGFAMTFWTEASADTPPTNLFTYAIPQGPQGIYIDSWIVGINETGIQIPATSVVVNLPDAPPITVDLLQWSPRCCYIYSPGSPYDEMPDPDMPQEQFEWHWYGQGLSMTVYLGYVAGHAGELYQINPMGVGVALLGRVRPGGGSPDGGAVAAVPATTELLLGLLALGLVFIARRRLSMPLRNG